MRRGYIQLLTLFGKVWENGDYRLARLAQTFQKSQEKEMAIRK
jgi:hypothetical protein